MTDIDDDDLFEGAKDEFAGKEDTKDRLVAILVDGSKGQRQGQNGKPYDWFSTTTIVLDDGPDGWQARVDTDTGMRDNLVPSVAESGPTVLRSFQWSAGGFASRLKDRTPDGKWLIGRVDEKKQKGKNAAWRPNPPTDADLATAREYASLLKAEKAKILAADIEPEF